MNGIIKLNGTELSISDNKSSDIALSSFSGYVGFVGEVSTRYGGTPGKTIGLVLNISSGIIAGTFDSNLNKSKEVDNIIGTAVVGYGVGWAGAEAGAIIGASISGPLAPIGAIVGALLGAVAGGLYGDDIYDNGEKIVDILYDKLSEKYSNLEFIDTSIHGIITKEEFILKSLKDDKNFCKRIFPKYNIYKQIEISSHSFIFYPNASLSHKTYDSLTKVSSNIFFNQSLALEQNLKLCDDILEMVA